MHISQITNQDKALEPLVDKIQYMLKRLITPSFKAGNDTKKKMDFSLIYLL